MNKWIGRHVDANGQEYVLCKYGKTVASIPFGKDLNVYARFYSTDEEKELVHPRFRPIVRWKSYEVVEDEYNVTFGMLE